MSTEFIPDTQVNTVGLYSMSNQSKDSFTRCIFAMDQALDSLSIPWFLNYGTALMYWRSKNFISDDMDIGVFYEDFQATNHTEKYFLSVMKKQFHFELYSKYGQIDNGQEWTFLCPQSQIRIDIFVFYAFNETNSSLAYWSASYNGLCNDMVYKKCRWGFSDFNVTTIELHGKLFQIVPISFIIEQYGKDYMTPKTCGYFDSLKFLPNLIREDNIRTKIDKLKMKQQSKNFLKNTTKQRR